MKVEFDIPDEKIQSLSQNGKEELIRHSKNLTEEIIDEASRIEASRRSSGTNTEITAAIVSDAAVYSRRFVPQIKKSTKSIIIQILAFFSSILTGSLFDIDKLNKPDHAIAFVIILIISVGTTVYLAFIPEKNG